MNSCRALSLFIGSVRAAHFGAQSLPGQPHYNRIRRGVDAPYSPEVRTMREIV
jgi:hypothetical protein